MIDFVVFGLSYQCWVLIAMVLFVIFMATNTGDG